MKNRRRAGEFAGSIVSRLWSWRGRLCVAMLLASLGATLPQMAGAASRAPAIWFAPLDWFVRPWTGAAQVRGPADYMQLFTTKPGQAALARVNTFSLAFAFVQWASDADLRTIIAELKRQHIPLVIGGDMLSGPGSNPSGCGRSVEGYAPANYAATLARRIAGLGGTVAYVAMDEPAFFGHSFSGKNACHSTFADIAANAAANIRAVKAIFPQAKVGDIEPVGPSPGNALIPGYRQWAEAFRQATGEKLAFFQADMQWRQPWQQPLKQLSEMLRRQGIPLGVIYNGLPSDQSDPAWVAHAEQNARAVEDQLGIVPDQAVISSWETHPSRMLPASNPGSYTYLISRYLAARHG